MAASSTAFVNCPKGDWTLLVDGASFASCKLQADGVMRIAVASSKPAAGSGDSIRPGMWPMLELTLDATDKVYGQPNTRIDGGVRVLKTART